MEKRNMGMTIAIPSRAAEPGRLLSILRQLALGVRDGMAAYRRYQRLSGLSDAELLRLGISRPDIARHACLGPRAA
jgi:hypothetical protein